MYYVLHVISGMEDRTEAYIRKVFSDKFQCFHLTRHMKKKYHGKWMDIYDRLLPGYLFIITNNAEELFRELKKVPMSINLLGRDGKYFVPLSDKEVAWLKNLLKYSGGWYEVELSQVCVKENNEINIISGPLKGIEGMIRKIHLHKRIAEVEIDFMNEKTILYLGIELIKQ